MGGGEGHSPPRGSFVIGTAPGPQSFGEIPRRVLLSDGPGSWPLAPEGHSSPHLKLEPMERAAPSGKPSSAVRRLQDRA